MHQTSIYFPFVIHLLSDNTECSSIYTAIVLPIGVGSKLKLWRPCCATFPGLYFNSCAVHGMAYDILLHHTLLSVYITIENLFISSYHKMEKCSYSLILAIYVPFSSCAWVSINSKPTSDRTILVSTISTNGIYTCTKEDITKGPVGTYAMLPWSILCTFTWLAVKYVEVPILKCNLCCGK